MADNVCESVKEIQKRRSGIWFMGPVKSVYGEIATLNHKIEVEDIGLAILEFANGAKGLINMTSTFPKGYYFDLEFHGTHGGAVIHDIVSIGDKDPILWLKDESKLKEIKGIEPEAIFNAAEDMARYIKYDITPPRGVTGEDGRSVVTLLQAIYKSARERRRIEL